MNYIENFEKRKDIFGIHVCPAEFSAEFWPRVSFRRNSVFQPKTNPVPDTTVGIWLISMPGNTDSKKIFEL